jgi:CheY-like chemotaxis protein
MLNTSRLTLLCVEDDPDISYVVKVALSLDANIAVHQVATSEDAWTALKNGLRPSLILLDDQLVGGSGTEFAMRLQQEKCFAELPHAFLTSAGLPRDLQRFEDTGAIGVIFKPFDPTTLADEIREMLERRTNFYLSI